MTAPVDGKESAASNPFSGVIAVDGPSGTGKSTVARALATRLGISYLDTGAMYRAATVAVLDAEIDPHDALAVAAVVAESVIVVSTDPTDPHTLLNGRNVDTEIRSAATTSAVSAVSAVPAVRHQLVALQQAAIDAGSFVVEGRDIASVVWPQAELKIYLTADPEVRAQRRAAQASAPDNTPAELNQIAADLHRRDTFDSSRTTSPLTQTTDAVEVDTSSMSIEGVVAHLAALAWQAIGVRAHD